MVETRQIRKNDTVVLTRVVERESDVYSCTYCSNFLEQNEGIEHQTGIELQNQKEGENYKERYMNRVVENNQKHIYSPTQWF